MQLLEPALIRYIGQKIEILVVYPMPEGLYAFVDGNVYRDVGTIKKTTRLSHGMDVEVWEARSIDRSIISHGRSRSSSTKALLQELGYYPIRVLDTIPTLF